MLMRRRNINKHLKTFIPDSLKRREAVTFSRRDKRALRKIKLRLIMKKFSISVYCR